MVANDFESMISVGWGNKQGGETKKSEFCLLVFEMRVFCAIL